MKKKILFITIPSLLIVVGIIFAIVFVFPKDKENEKVDSVFDVFACSVDNFSLIKASNVDELNTAVKENGYKLIKAESGKAYCVENVELANQKITLYYVVDGNGDFSRVDGFFEMKAENLDREALELKLTNFRSMVGRFFDIEAQFDYDIYSEDGYELDPYVEESFDEILSAGGKFGLSAVDVDGTYWNATAYITEDKSLRFDFFHSFESGVYETGEENIILNDSLEPEA